ncbi:MAG TPA: VOC family protein [Casimicrobiaceae bacterium]|nr:VOC family protein [Casimicrobiaceae bacterium]
MEPIIDHIQITVKDLASAVAFYDKFLPLIGFDPRAKGHVTIEKHDFEVVEYSHPRLSFAITSPRTAFRDDDVHRRKPGSLHHLAFRASSREEVDRIHDELKALGVNIVSPPRLYPEYKPTGYYAVFFKDPHGIKYEIVTHDRANAPPL